MYTWNEITIFELHIFKEPKLVCDVKEFSTMIYRVKHSVYKPYLMHLITESTFMM